MYHPSSPLLKPFWIEYRSGVSLTAWPLTARKVRRYYFEPLTKKWSSASTWPKIFYQSPPAGRSCQVSWCPHRLLPIICNICVQYQSHILRQVSMINRVNYFLPPDILVTLYYSFIYPYISYCGSVWGNTYPSVTNKLKSAQNRAVKAVFRLPRLYPTKDLYSNFGIIPFEQIIKKLNLSLAYSAYHKIFLPTYYLILIAIILKATVSVHPTVPSLSPGVSLVPPSDPQFINL